MEKTYNKKILFVITDFGSFNNFLSEIAIELSQIGIDVHVITSSEKIINIEDRYNYSEYNIFFHYFKFPRSFNLIKHFQMSSAIQRKINEINPNIISLHFTTGIFTTVLSGKLAYKTLGTFHGLGYPVISNPIKRQIFKAVELFSAARLDEIWVLNKSDQSLLSSYFKQVYLLPTNGLGCDLNKFDAAKYIGDSSPLKSKLSISDGDIVITFTGRYVNFKGYDIVIRTFRELEKKLKNLKLITMGGYDEIHPTGLTKEEEIYKTNNPNIIDIGFTKEVEKYLAITDLFFFPSKKEGIPICIVEALAMGIPVVTFDARGCNDLVSNNYTGKLMPLDSDHVDFAESIEELLINSKKLELIRQNIAAKRDELSRNRFINQQVKYFRDI